MSNANPRGPDKPLTKVDTTPFDVILLIVPFPALEQYKLPLLSNSKPDGWFNPVLTKVDTTPANVLLLIVLIP